MTWDKDWISADLKLGSSFVQELRDELVYSLVTAVVSGRITRKEVHKYLDWDSALEDFENLLAETVAANEEED